MLLMMQMITRTIPTIVVWLCACATLQTVAQTVKTDVLIIGGGASGITAGIQAARMKTPTLIVEETPWLGGMLTAAGVSATDGNHRLAGGLWGEFRQKLRDHYGGADKLETGWVSNTQFEPHVGDSIWKAMTKRESKFLSVRHGWYLVSVQKQGKRVVGATFKNVKGGKASPTLVVQANVVVDATELGDAVALAGVPFDVGMEARATSSEPVAPREANSIIQDLTYVAVLKDYGEGADRRIAKPADYDPKEFACCCKESCTDVSPDSAAKIVDAQKMLDYGKLPTREFLQTGRGAKYMLNWPRVGNDYYTNVIPLSREERLKEYAQAKARTMRFVYHIQSTLGFKHLGLADDEFPTPDSLALIPYHRESRRAQGLVRFTTRHLSAPYNYTFYRTAIAVGDYPIDHHHARYPRPEEVPTIDFPAVPSYGVPFGVLIPKGIEALVCAEKNISVSNIVNGTTRLQPCVMLIGQAAGAFAALLNRTKGSNNEVTVRSVQQELLNAGCWLLPFLDVPPESPYFQAVQKVGLVGALRGRGVPYKWANQTWFDADSTLTVQEFTEAAYTALGMFAAAVQAQSSSSLPPTQPVSLAEAFTILQSVVNAATTPVKDLQKTFPKELTALRRELTNAPHSADEARLLTRKEAALLLHRTLKPFERLPMDIFGKITFKRP